MKRPTLKVASHTSPRFARAFERNLELESEAASKSTAGRLTGISYGLSRASKTAEVQDRLQMKFLQPEAFMDVSNFLHA
ncbi:hypothetical protein [Pseudomonas nitroreducens]|uniref:hypothetical protein n=1 Tax=Pseudomonas nitroreducens TaxID=46680 RepID=UPI00209DB406|nr:hypothetical protein [Pseudomonas nitroreducens]MCP1626455.1 hypothetical protein [Pseudomonas nitroreducens]